MASSLASFVLGKLSSSSTDLQTSSMADQHKPKLTAVWRTKSIPYEIPSTSSHRFKADGSLLKMLRTKSMPTLGLEGGATISLLRAPSPARSMETDAASFASTSTSPLPQVSSRHINRRLSEAGSDSTFMSITTPPATPRTPSPTSQRKKLTRSVSDGHLWSQRKKQLRDVRKEFPTGTLPSVKTLKQKFDSKFEDEFQKARNDVRPVTLRNAQEYSTDENIQVGKPVTNNQPQEVITPKKDKKKKAMKKRRASYHESLSKWEEVSPEHPRESLHELHLNSVKKLLRKFEVSEASEVDDGMFQTSTPRKSSGKIENTLENTQTSSIEAPEKEEVSHRSDRKSRSLSKRDYKLARLRARSEPDPAAIRQHWSENAPVSVKDLKMKFELQSSLETTPFQYTSPVKVKKSSTPDAASTKQVVNRVVSSEHTGVTEVIETMLSSEIHVDSSSVQAMTSKEKLAKGESIISVKSLEQTVNAKKSKSLLKSSSKSELMISGEAVQVGYSRLEERPHNFTTPSVRNLRRRFEQASSTLSDIKTGRGDNANKLQRPSSPEFKLTNEGRLKVEEPQGLISENSSPAKSSNFQSPSIRNLRRQFETASPDDDTCNRSTTSYLAKEAKDVTTKPQTKTKRKNSRVETEDEVTARIHLATTLSSAPKYEAKDKDRSSSSSSSSSDEEEKQGLMFWNKKKRSDGSSKSSSSDEDGEVKRDKMAELVTEKERRAREKWEWKEKTRKEKEIEERERHKKKAELEKIAWERVERERINKEREEREKIKARMEKERAEREREESERAEREREERERAERKKAEKERAERERAKIKKAEKERAERDKAERERAERERKEKERKEEALKEKAERERAAKEKILVAQQEKIYTRQSSKRSSDSSSSGSSSSSDSDDEDRERVKKLEEERRRKEKLEMERLQQEKKAKIEKLTRAIAAEERKDREKAERERQELERKEKERLERERKEKEEKERARLKAIQEGIVKERAEKERQAKEKAEKETLEREKAEKERKEREKAERERKEREKVEKERKEREKAEKERKEREKVEKERKEREKAEKDRKEREKAEKERKEREKAEKERKEREKAEKERKEQEKAEKERKEREKAEKERKEREKAEKERKEREKAEKERKEREKAEKERKEREKAERERKEREQTEKEKADRERALQEKIIVIKQEKIYKRSANSSSDSSSSSDSDKEEDLGKLIKVVTERDVQMREMEERERMRRQSEEKEKREREKAEEERRAKERKDREKAEKEKTERQKREKEKTDQERKKKEKEEQQRKEKEKKEHEKREKEKAKQERKQKEKAEQEKRESERKEEEKRDRDKKERDRLEQEKRDRDRKERDRLEQEKKRETEKSEHDKLDGKEDHKVHLLVDRFQKDPIVDHKPRSDSVHSDDTDIFERDVNVGKLIGRFTNLRDADLEDDSKEIEVHPAGERRLSDVASLIGKFATIMDRRHSSSSDSDSSSHESRSKHVAPIPKIPAMTTPGNTRTLREDEMKFFTSGSNGQNFIRSQSLRGKKSGPSGFSQPRFGSMREKRTKIEELTEGKRSDSSSSDSDSSSSQNSKKRSVTPSPKPVSVNAPGSTRTLREDELKYFTTGNAEQNFIRSQSLRVKKNESSSFQHRFGSMREKKSRVAELAETENLSKSPKNLPKNCRNLRPDEMEFFRGGSLDFYKSRQRTDSNNSKSELESKSTNGTANTGWEQFFRLSSQGDQYQASGPSEFPGDDPKQSTSQDSNSDSDDSILRSGDLEEDIDSEMEYQYEGDELEVTLKIHDDQDISDHDDSLDLEIQITPVNMPTEIPGLDPVNIHVNEIKNHIVFSYQDQSNDKETHELRTEFREENVCSKPTTENGTFIDLQVREETRPEQKTEKERWLMQKTSDEKVIPDKVMNKERDIKCDGSYVYERSHNIENRVEEVNTLKVLETYCVQRSVQGRLVENEGDCKYYGETKEKIIKGQNNSSGNISFTKEITSAEELNETFKAFQDAKRDATQNRANYERRETLPIDESTNEQLLEVYHQRPLENSHSLFSYTNIANTKHEEKRHKEEARERAEEKAGEDKKRESSSDSSSEDSDSSNEDDNSNIIHGITEAALINIEEQIIKTDRTKSLEIDVPVAGQLERRMTTLCEAETKENTNMITKGEIRMSYTEIKRQVETESKIEQQIVPVSLAEIKQVPETISSTKSISSPDIEGSEGLFAYLAQLGPEGEEYCARQRWKGNRILVDDDYEDEDLAENNEQKRDSKETEKKEDSEKVTKPERESRKSYSEDNRETDTVTESFADIKEDTETLTIPDIDGLFAYLALLGPEGEEYCARPRWKGNRILENDDYEEDEEEILTENKVKQETVSENLKEITETVMQHDSEMRKRNTEDKTEQKIVPVSFSETNQGPETVPSPEIGDSEGLFAYLAQLGPEGEEYCARPRWKGNRILVEDDMDDGEVCPSPSKEDKRDIETKMTRRNKEMGGTEEVITKWGFVRFCVLVTFLATITYYFQELMSSWMGGL